MILLCIWYEAVCCNYPSDVISSESSIWFSRLECKLLETEILSLLLPTHRTVSDTRSLLLSRSVMSDSLWPHGLQHTRLPCPSLFPGVCSDSCLLRSLMPSNHLILCCPLLLLSIFPSIRVFSSELTLHIRWSKHWSFRFSISQSSEYSGLISFRIDWFDVLAVQGIFKSLLQHHS